MPRLASLSRVLAVVTLSFAAAASASSNDAGWRQDLDALERELPRMHANAFFHVSRAAFEQAIDGLRNDLPVLADHQVTVRMQMIVAMLGDAHTTLAGLGYKRYPIGVYWFSDGIHGIRATETHRDVLGLRLEAINGHPIGSVVTEVAQVYSYENEWWMRDQLPTWIVAPEVLHTLGIVETTGAATFTFATTDGQLLTRDLAPVTPATAFVEFPDREDVPLPLYLRSPELNYWFEYLPAERIVYLKYNRCRDMPGKPFTALAQEMGEVFATNAVDRVVLDMRHNSGGNSAVLQPLITNIQTLPELNRHDAFFVIIARRTFSSAMLNAIELDQQTNATFVGEPTGGKPNGYGEVRSFMLPISRLTVTYSTKFFRLAQDGDPPSFFPDHFGTMSSTDYFEGRDPMLARVLPSPVRRRSVRK